MTELREVIESPLDQGKDETISYQITTTPWCTAPSLPVVTIYDVTGGIYTALSVAELAIVMPVNNPTIAGDVITLSPLKALTVDKVYRVEVKFTAGGDVWEAWFLVHGQN